MATTETTAVCYVLSYYSPDYTRTTTLVGALQRIPGISLLEARNRSVGPWRYLETLVKLLRIRIKHRPDIFILGFRGMELFWPVRLLAAGRSLIYDHMMSPYDSLVNETEKLQKDSLTARLLLLYEKTALRAADIVLTDTRLHKEYFEDLYGLPPEKVYVVPIGADEMFLARARETLSAGTKDSLDVLFYGSFLPLHGIDVILKAAFLLKNEPVHFLLIGGNRQDLSRFQSEMQSMALTNLEHREWVRYEDLPDVIEQADLCLGGPFGNTGQARRVVTGKTAQCLSMGRATVVGAIDCDFGFADRENCLLVEQGKADRLAEAIQWALDNRRELPRIGQAGRRLFQARFSSDVIADALSRILSS
jgi:glycosyltransferase involved in cell wall biosynthesis